MAQLYWHKSRLVTLGPKIEALSDNHPSKADCLWDLARLFDSVGNFAERKRLLGHALELWKEQEDAFQVARTLRNLSDVNRQMDLYGEGIPLAKVASEIFERLGEVVHQAECLIILAWLLCDAEQLDAAEEAGSRAIYFLLDKGEPLWTCAGHRALGEIYQCKGETQKAVDHLEVALGIASSLNMVDQLFWIHYSLAEVFSEPGKFEDAQAHLERAEVHAVNDAYLLARAVEWQARLWDRQGRFEDARFEALRALDAFERLGATNDAKDAKQLLRQIEVDTLDDSNDDGELLETILVVHCVNFSWSQNQMIAPAPHKTFEHNSFPTYHRLVRSLAHPLSSRRSLHTLPPPPSARRCTNALSVTYLLQSCTGP